MGVCDKTGEMWSRDTGMRAGRRLRIVVNAAAQAPAAAPAVTLPLARAFDTLSVTP